MKSDVVYRELEILKSMIGEAQPDVRILTEYLLDLDSTDATYKSNEAAQAMGVKKESYSRYLAKGMKRLRMLRSGFSAKEIEDALNAWPSVTMRAPTQSDSSEERTYRIVSVFCKCMPGNCRKEILGDILEECYEQREEGVREWSIRVNAISKICLAIVTSILGGFTNTCQKAWCVTLKSFIGRD